jgi:malonyl-CoA O-methyltransferase
MNMRAAQEFSRFAGTYGRHNRIQAQVAEKLISMLPKKRYGAVLDLGCGSGEVYRNLKARDIAFDHLTAVDISAEMLRRHPSEKSITKIQGDFNSPDDLKSLSSQRYDLLLSSSALQWSSDLNLTLSVLSKLSGHFYFAIFTSGTFRSLHRSAGITSPIRSETQLREKIAMYYNAAFETVHYELQFDSVYKMLRYIKESGTSGGERHLSYLQTKQLLKNYPYDYLEFEVLFVSPKS